jgi:Lon protease-like protein
MSESNDGPELTTLGILLLPLVLIPHEELALHATSRRHSQLIADLRVAGSEEFGIAFAEGNVQDGVPIVGTVAHIEVSSPYTHGRWSLIVTGLQRFRVVRWVSRDPYPTAEVQLLADDDPEGLEEIAEEAEVAVRRVRSLLSELGDKTTADEMDVAGLDDPATLAWRLVAVAPLTAREKNRLLGIDDAKHRIGLLRDLVNALYGDFAPLGQQGRG